MSEEFEDLVSLTLFGEITEEQKGRLDQIVHQDPSLKGRYENYIRMQEGLKLHKEALFKPVDDRSKMTSFQMSKKNIFRNRALLLAAAIPLIVSIYLLIRFQIPSQTDSIVIQTLGDCDPQSVAADWIRMDENHFCDVKLLRTQGLIQFRIFPNSAVKILSLPKTNGEKESLSLYFEKGSLLLNETIVTQDKTKIFWNGTRIELLGTKVLIEDSKTGRSLKVWDGSASVRSGIRYLLPFLLFPPKDWTQTIGEKDKDLLNDIRNEIVSDSILETKPFLFTGDSKILFGDPNGFDSDQKRKLEELRKIKNILTLDLNQNKTTKFTPQNLKELEKVLQNLGSLQIPDLGEKAAEPVINDKKEKTSVRAEKIKFEKEEPIRLGNKTIKLKDGSEWKGNLIQYENQYVLEIEGTKRIIKAEDVESISF
ncbi:transcriptional regulator [Leptospira sp. 201903070]|uniref:Transcriptional regulator n=1 Tax=Leptospira ainlahdjerensis TaxID=2810033 RepID=A0ABS2UCU8_9LEPT|nr:transcriptional regulator [Leptospira ainlahdjerensis]MBM9577768.1 transcriptional regulator [Leptospira ainlahdjerensis]